MATTLRKTTKAGKVFYLVTINREHGLTPYRTRWYPKESWSSEYEKQQLNKFVSQFETDCKNGEFLTRAQQKEKAAREEAEAKAEAARIEAEQARIAAEQAKLKTVKGYAEEIFMYQKKNTLSENARYNYQMFLDKHIYPTLGDCLLVDVSTAMIKKLLSDFQNKGYSHSSCIRLYNILNGVFKSAFYDDSIEKNPMDKVQRPAPRKGENLETGGSKAYSAKELNYVLSCVDDDSVSLKWKTYIYLAADTGARRGELCGLQWADIDWSAGLIRIERNLQYSPGRKDLPNEVGRGVYITSPKNGKARIVDVGQEALDLLRKLRAAQTDFCISPWVFTQEEIPEDSLPRPMHPQSPTWYFKKFGERFSIPNFHPHILRHTVASLMAKSGNVDYKSAADRLGHSTDVFTSVYVHTDEDSIRRAGQAAREALRAVNG